MKKNSSIIGISLIVTSIILGAFAAHGLEKLVSPEKLLSFETGVKYQMYGGLALLLVAFNDDKFVKSPTWFYRLLLTGVLLFSGSIYLLSLQEVLDMKLKLLGPITPIGGLFMICAWISLLLSVLSTAKKS
ncbi:MAG: DUF423 domain-containing protein [Bacteroidota bacterium]